ncbi:MFS general substrate transporter [Microthyrium microscopicum]|uniref:Efflux pump dotC n=1 Tax=Microthyrium microscopicum TaxID=703497 RepID=A0A6A6URY6_9PEZI|nr:MFS general substrate transporter [Microthyrium microscopicum]
MSSPLRNELGGDQTSKGLDRTRPTPLSTQHETDLEKEDHKSEKSLPSPTYPPAAVSPTADAEEQDVEKGEIKPTPSNVSQIPERSRAKTAILMFALCMCVFLAALDVTIVTTALPTIAEHFHSSSGYTWIGSAYLLGAASSTAIWAKISDIFGRKPILQTANVVFFAGSLIAALSTSISMLIAARAIQGIGGGGLITMVNVSIGDLFSMRTRGMYYGLVGFVWAIASAIGPLLGGVFAQKVTWRWIFYINIPFQGICFLITTFLLHIHKPKTAFLAGFLAIDWVGSILIVGGIIMFLLGLEFGGVSHPWTSAIVLCLIIFGVAAVVLFGINEYFIAKYPIIPLHIFKYRSNVAVFIVCFCHGFVFIGGSYYLPLYFQGVLGHGPIISGVLLLANVLPLSFMSTASGFFIRKTGLYQPPIWFGLVFMTIGYGTFISFNANPGLGKIIGFQILAGLGTGPNFQAPLIALQSLVPPGDIASAVATFQLVRNVATSMSVVIGAVVFQNSLKSKTGQLKAALGDQLANQLSGFNAAASAQVITSLPPAQRDVARNVFASSLRDMWIMYTVVAFVGLLVSFFITRQQLDKKHAETKTGLKAEEEKRVEREERRKSRRESKQAARLSGGPRSPGMASVDGERSLASPLGSPTVAKAGDKETV